jgi:hypothetical protein
MTAPGEYKSQLVDLSVRLSTGVAERLAMWSKDMDPNERRKVLTMIEEHLPIVIANTIEKTASLHSASGVKYLEEHLDEWADSWARRFISGN